MRLLIVEDEPDLLRTLAQALREEGHAVDEAADGEEGLFKALETDYDAVVLDLMLPVIDGFEVLRRLRAQPATAHIPCIALSANAMPEDIARATAAGFSDYWTKPIILSEFLAALERLFPG